MSVVSAMFYWYIIGDAQLWQVIVELLPSTRVFTVNTLAKYVCIWLSSNLANFRTIYLYPPTIILISQGLSTQFQRPWQSAAWAERFLTLVSLLINELSIIIWVELFVSNHCAWRGNMIVWQPPSIHCDSQNAGQLFRTSWIATPGNSCDWPKVLFHHHVKSVQLRRCQGLWNRVLRAWLVRMPTRSLLL